jgi:hypothetical protein
MAAQEPEPAEATEDGGSGESPIRRRILREGAVGRQIFFGGGMGGPGCWLNLSVTGRQDFGTTAECTVNVLTQVTVNMFDFATDGAIDVELVGPDGTTRRTLTADSPDGSIGSRGGMPLEVNRQVLGRNETAVFWSGAGELGSPVGRYELRATQGSNRLTAVVMVRTDYQPEIRTQEPAEGPPGTTYRFAVAGLPPNQRVPMHLYRDIYIQTAWYVTELPPVQTNGRGEAVYNLRSAADDPPGFYYVVPGTATAEQPAISGTDSAKFRLLAPGSADSAWQSPGPEDLVQAVVEEANRRWATVVARDGAPVSTLDTILAGPWLATVRQSVEAMRQNGQYRVARPTAPIAIQSVRTYPPGTRRCYFNCQFEQIEAFVTEQWDDRLYNLSGAQLRVEPPRVEQRYLLERVFQDGHPCELCWVIVESDLRRGS